MNAPKIVNLSVAEAYDRWAQDYDTYDNPMLQSLALVQAQFPYDLSGKSVFEFGCGTGRNLAWAKAKGAAKLAGSDLSAGMLKQARQRLPDAELSEGDMLQPQHQVTDRSIDHAFFCLTLEHIKDMVMPLSEAKRMLQPSGVITIAEIHPFLAWGGGKAHFKQGGEEIHMPTVAHRFSDYVNAFRTTGLNVVSCREVLAGEVSQDPSAKVMKRGAEAPLMIVFHLVPQT